MSEFFLKSWHWLIWPIYSDLWRSIFFDGSWPQRILLSKRKRVLVGHDLSKKLPWKVTANMPNKPGPPFQKKIWRFYLQVSFLSYWLRSISYVLYMLSGKENASDALALMPYPNYNHTTVDLKTTPILLFCLCKPTAVGKKRFAS